MDYVSVHPESNRKLLVSIVVITQIKLFKWLKIKRDD